MEPGVRPSERPVSSRVEWLLSYMNARLRAYEAVLAAEKEDFSEDAVKVVLHRERFSHFLMGRDEQIVPITFEMWPSLTCDARCRCCTYVLNSARAKVDRSRRMVLAVTKSYLAILNDLRNAGVNSVIFTGGGEPLLNPDLPALVHKAAEVGLKWGLFTNGHTITDSVMEQLLAAEPRFVRISINAGSNVGYENEYRLGVGSYNIVKKKVIRFVKASSRTSQRCVGLNYALDGFVGSKELSGIVDFVSEVMETTRGALATVAFRPKVVYFDVRGKPKARQSRASGLHDLAYRIQDEVVTSLHSRFHEALRIDHKFGMFLRAASGVIQPVSQATPWTSQMDHRGVGFITSELNGTPWPGFNFGVFNGSNFMQTWFSDRRLALMKDFANGSGRVPVHHKISHIDTLLLDVRNAVGVLSEPEVWDFWNRLEVPTTVRNQNWDFL